MSTRIASLAVAAWSLSVIACCCIPDTTNKQKADKPAERPSPPDAALQAKRLDIIEGYKKERVIFKIEDSTVAKLHVMPRFYTLPFDHKKTVANLVYVWFYKCPNPVNTDHVNPGDHVRIIDHANGKQVGSYDPIGGLSMDR